MSDVPRSFDLTTDPDYDSAYMATELPSVDHVHPAMVGEDELIMCVHLIGEESVRYLTFPKSFLAEPPANATDEEKLAYVDECDERMSRHAERILRAVWN